MMSKRLRNEGYRKAEARKIIKEAFKEEIKKDKKRLVNLIMTYTRTFWRRAPTNSLSQPAYEYPDPFIIPHSNGKSSSLLIHDDNDIISPQDVNDDFFARFEKETTTIHKAHHQQHYHDSSL